jgi:hypothetical protein
MVPRLGDRFTHLRIDGEREGRADIADSRFVS